MTLLARLFNILLGKCVFKYCFKTTGLGFPQGFSILKCYDLGQHADQLLKTWKVVEIDDEN